MYVLWLHWKTIQFPTYRLVGLLIAMAFVKRMTQGKHKQWLSWKQLQLPTKALILLNLHLMYKLAPNDHIFPNASFRINIFSCTNILYRLNSLLSSSHEIIYMQMGNTCIALSAGVTYSSSPSLTVCLPISHSPWSHKRDSHMLEGLQGVFLLHVAGMPKPNAEQGLLHPFMVP